MHSCKTFEKDSRGQCLHNANVKPWVRVERGRKKKVLYTEPYAAVLVSQNKVFLQKLTFFFLNIATSSGLLYNKSKTNADNLEKRVRKGQQKLPLALHQTQLTHTSFHCIVSPTVGFFSSFSLTEEFTPAIRGIICDWLSGCRRCINARGVGKPAAL